MMEHCPYRRVMLSCLLLLLLLCGQLRLQGCHHGLHALTCQPHAAPLVRD